MDGEDLLDADPEGDPADREGFGAPHPIAGQDDSGENLDAFLFAFLDLDMHANRVANFEGRNVGLQRFGIDLIDNFAHHGFISSSNASIGTRHPHTKTTYYFVRVEDGARLRAPPSPLPVPGSKSGRRLAVTRND